jgi:hypothetical protein
MHLERLQNWAQNGPMANDKQVEPITAMLTLASLATQAYGAYSAAKGADTPTIGPNEIRRRLSRTQGVANQMQGQYGLMSRIGTDLMDPNSGVNQQQYQMMQDQGQNQLALQQLLARRQAASMGQDSGITHAQSQGAAAQSARNLGQQYQQALSQNRQVGIGTLGQAQGLLGRIGQMQTGIDENIAQAAIARNQQKRQDELRRNQMMAQGMSGLGSGLMEAGTVFSPQSGVPTGFDMATFMQGYVPEGYVWDEATNKIIPG